MLLFIVLFISCQDAPVNDSGNNNDSLDVFYSIKIDSINLFWEKQLQNLNNYYNNEIDSMESKNKNLNEFYDNKITDLIKDFENHKGAALDSLENVHRFSIDSLKLAYNNIISSLTLTANQLTIRIDELLLKAEDLRDSLDLARSNRIDTVEVFRDPVFDLIEIVPVSVKVDTVAAGTELNLIDNIPMLSLENKGTRWAVPGYPHQAIFGFGEVKKIDFIEINTYAWYDNFTHSFKVFNFSDLILEDSTRSELYSRHEINFIGSALYLEVTGGKNSWSDIGEVKFYEKVLKID
jgi:hypothetical protein